MHLNSRFSVQLCAIRPPGSPVQRVSGGSGYSDTPGIARSRGLGTPGPLQAKSVICLQQGDYGRVANDTARASAAFLPCSGRALEIRRAVSRGGRSSGEPQAAEFEILENAAGEGPEAVVVAGPVALRPQLLFFPERISISKRTSSLGAGRLSWLCMGLLAKLGTFRKHITCRRAPAKQATASDTGG